MTAGSAQQDRVIGHEIDAVFAGWHLLRSRPKSKRNIDLDGGCAALGCRLWRRCENSDCQGARQKTCSERFKVFHCFVLLFAESSVYNCLHSLKRKPAALSAMISGFISLGRPSGVRRPLQEREGLEPQRSDATSFLRQLRALIR